MRDKTTAATDPTLARAMAICRANGYEPRRAQELAARDEELRRLRSAQRAKGERSSAAELADALVELERLRELRREDLAIIRAAFRLTRAEALAARASTLGPLVLVREREAIEARRALRDLCADVMLRRIARALRGTDDAPADTPASVDAFAHELRAKIDRVSADGAGARSAAVTREPEAG